MGVVELDRELVGELADRGALEEQPDGVLQRARHEEVLLLEPQLLAGRARVVRVEHLGQILAADLLIHRAPVLADLERVEVELLVGRGAPQPQEARGLGAVARDRDVVRDALDRVRREPADAEPPVRPGRVLGEPAEPDRVLDLEPPDLPRVAVAQPAVGALDLPAVADLLVERAELVAQAVADRRDVERRERLHEARREPAEAAVAEPRLLLVLDELVERYPELRERGARRGLQVERQEVGAELGADQELG